MRLGIDCRKILNPESGEQAGIAHYTYFLVKHLLACDKKNHYTLFFDKRVASVKEFEGSNVKAHIVPFSQYKKYLPFAYSHLLFSGELEEARLDLFHSPFPIIPLRYKGASVITVHDMAIYHHPEWFPGAAKQILSTKVLVPRAIKQAKRIISVSEFTKRDVMDLFKVSEEKITVIPEGVAQEDLRFKISDLRFSAHGGSAFGGKIQKPYILFLGTIEPRKNIKTIIDAFVDLQKSKIINLKSKINIELLIAGGKGWNNEEIFKAIKAAGPSVRHLGAVSHEEKLALMSHAAVFVWPSLWEGFGLPVLEAMSLGVPVITSNTTSLPEVVGEAALTIDPENKDELGNALRSVLRDENLRQELSRKGKERARQFTWDKTAQKTLEVYEQCVKA